MSNADLTNKIVEQELVQAVISDSVLGKAIWNAAVEASAKTCSERGYPVTSIEIRKLKK